MRERGRGRERERRGEDLEGEILKRSQTGDSVWLGRVDHQTKVLKMLLKRKNQTKLPQNK